MVAILDGIKAVFARNSNAPSLSIGIVGNLQRLTIIVPERDIYSFKTRKIELGIGSDGRRILQTKCTFL